MNYLEDHVASPRVERAFNKREAKETRRKKNVQKIVGNVGKQRIQHVFEKNNNDTNNRRNREHKRHQTTY